MKQRRTRKSVDAAYDAFQKGVWSKIPPGDRANLILKVAAMLVARPIPSLFEEENTTLAMIYESTS